MSNNLLPIVIVALVIFGVCYAIYYRSCKPEYNDSAGDFADDIQIRREETVGLAAVHEALNLSVPPPLYDPPKMRRVRKKAARKPARKTARKIVKKTARKKAQR